MNKEVDLKINLGPLSLKNPLMPASGTFDINDTILSNELLSKLGALVTKSISLEKRPGNPGPRVWETDCGMLNSAGIPSKGFDRFLEEDLPLLEASNDTVIVSIVGDTERDFCNLANKLDKIKSISALEINLSCPNLNNDLHFGINKEIITELIFNIKKNTQKVVIAKLSPNVSDITEIAKAAEQAGADIITIANTLIGMAIDVEKQKPRLGNSVGGLSGPAIRPIIVRMVWETSKVVQIPIIGVGGITCAEDALEMLLAGASAIQIGAANFSNPLVMHEIIDGIRRYLIRKKYDSISEIIGMV